MIHLSTHSPFRYTERAVLYGKGPSYDPTATVGERTTLIGINDAATQDMDFIALRDWTTAERIHPRPADAIVEQSVWFRFPTLWEPDDFYFDGHRVYGTSMPSKTVSGFSLGVGTATAVIQMLAESGCREVWLNGFDAFWGGTIEYGTPFQARGLSHEDYAKEFPVSGTPEEQAALVRESIQLVADRFNVDLHRLG